MNKCLGELFVKLFIRPKEYKFLNECEYDIDNCDWRKVAEILCDISFRFIYFGFFAGIAFILVLLLFV